MNSSGDVLKIKTTQTILIRFDDLYVSRWIQARFLENGGLGQFRILGSFLLTHKLANSPRGQIINGNEVFCRQCWSNRVRIYRVGWDTIYCCENCGQLELGPIVFPELTFGQRDIGETIGN